jgi:AraC-like DNA-binding protein
LAELGPQEELHARSDPAIVLQHGDDKVRFLNPGEIHLSLDASRVLAFHAAGEWLRASFPAVFGPEGRRPFPNASELITPRIRQLADTLAIEVLNDRFLSPERLEFMLQELVLSIVETYLTKRRGSSSLWRGSRFADTRVRRAIALLRAHPNKDLNMDDVASEVGLSRSRFYDLFQLCTGFSPRAYLDMLCVETAISRLSCGEGKIAEVSAELGFSAQSNFTRFFLHQVGVPPSAYRRAATRDIAPEPKAPEKPDSQA